MTVKFSPKYCITVFYVAFDVGLNFPPHPLAVEVLDIFFLMDIELYTNVPSCIIEFVIVFRVLGVRLWLSESRFGS